MTAAAEIAVIGGSGFYSLFDDPVQVTPPTPYGEVSGPITVGQVEGRAVAFLPRHGPGHHLPPDRINARANLWALRELGVRRVIGPCAVGSLRPDLVPGDFVILDQLVDRTWGRPDTFLDGPQVGHVGFADPYCPELSGAILAAAGDDRVRPSGTVVVIQGPRFSTRAESRWFRAAGWDVVNMTQYPEAYLARELGLCYAGLALVTDHDSGAEGAEGTVGDPVTMERVMAVLADNVARTRNLLARAIPRVPAEPGCGCQTGGSPLLARR
ncbi:S-methyl-5'-thioadenosine phosphorylase [Acidiferrimicrobium sp. IK]|uniref:S-methyl-5'-thioadenosine phosphorylase n=1 Tax=Acidiferrimicrobium sp. IK TaxID=2871700 RepID=UPI0021CB5062|nr:S-methyl-5'-thioadenosine phosphorylase [Acidiferrimicrobium sp. IK]MCU4185360.1 S-methyl-5'-thioadenosine phosphorylase [Acidiferrimicrobium sp. IK]